MYRHSGPPHDNIWSSVFCCPLTGEVFPSGRYPTLEQPRDVVFDEGTQQEVIWYSRKMSAEHAAAARAHDCIAFRIIPDGELAPPRMGQDEPYTSENAMQVPSSIPLDLREKIGEVQARLRYRHPGEQQDDGHDDDAGQQGGNEQAEAGAGGDNAAAGAGADAGGGGFDGGVNEEENAAEVAAGEQPAGNNDIGVEREIADDEGNGDNNQDEDDRFADIDEDDDDEEL